MHNYSERIRRKWKRAVSRVTPPFLRSLTDWAHFYGTDKGEVDFEGHGYTKIYEYLFSSFKSNEIALFEIGLKHPDDANEMRTIPSLRMWEKYFVHGYILGFDIQDFRRHAHGRIHIVQGDQSKPNDLIGAVKSIPASHPLKVVIDDGSHASYHQLISLRTLYPAMPSGGIYVIEDLHFQPRELEDILPMTPKLFDLLRNEQMLIEIGIRKENVAFHCSDKLAVISKP